MSTIPLRKETHFLFISFVRHWVAMKFFNVFGCWKCVERNGIVWMDVWTNFVWIFCLFILNCTKENVFFFFWTKKDLEMLSIAGNQVFWVVCYRCRYGRCLIIGYWFSFRIENYNCSELTQILQKILSMVSMTLVGVADTPELPATGFTWVLNSLVIFSMKFSLFGYEDLASLSLPEYEVTCHRQHSQIFLRHSVLHVNSRVLNIRNSFLLNFNFRKIFLSSFCLLQCYNGLSLLRWHLDCE